MADAMMADGTNPPLLESAEARESGRLEAHAQALFYLLRVFSLNHRTARIGLSELHQFVKAYSPRFVLKFPQLEDFGQKTEGLVDTYLRVLAGHGLCELEQEGEEIRWVFFPQYYTELIHRAYHDLEQQPERPFPSEEGLKITLPANLVTEVNIKTDFVSTLGELRPERPIILRLLYPELIGPMVVTSDLVERKLLELSVLKLRVYLNTRNNATFAMHRLQPVLRGNEHGLREMVTAIMTKPGKAVASLQEPSDFTFRFWAHFASLILQEFKDKTEKLEEETSYCQAAYLVGFYNVHYRGRLQKQTEKTSLYRKFEHQFHKYPYAYTMKDLYGVRDEKGLPLVGKNSREAFVEFLEAKTKIEGYQILPEIVRLRTVQGKDYYVHRDLIIPLFSKMLYDKAGEVRDYYLDEWEKLLRQNKRTLAMVEDQEFAHDLDTTVKDKAPFLYALLNYSLLHLAKNQGKISYDQSKLMDRCLDEKNGQLHSLETVLGVSRKELLDSAKLRIPVWQRLMIFKGLLYLLQRLVRGLSRILQEARQRPDGSAAPPAAAPDRAAAGHPTATAEATTHPGEGKSTTLRPSSARQLAAYKKAVHALKAQFVGAEKTIPESLQELVEKWNPLYDGRARSNLVEDVNAMIRDYLRTIRRTFRVSPPDAARIRSLAAKLAENRAFDRIKRKDLFVRYVEIYMVKLLGDR
jgi:hypothetical protein